MLDIKNETYKEATEFLNYFKEDNSKVLINKYDISIEFFNEINEVILENFTSNKAELNLPPLSDIKDPDKNLCFIQPVDEKKLYVVEFDIFLKGKPSDLTLIAEYQIDDYFPKFEFRYFRV